MADRSATSAVTVRPEIAQSWARSRTVGLVPEAALSNIPTGDFDPGSRLMAAARPVLDQLEAKLAGSEYSTVLADRDCRIVYRWFDDARAEGIFDGLGVRPGTTLLEECVGTNALGTALELRRGIAITGAEHYADVLKPFSCYGQPIRHPLTSRIEGVLDFTAVGNLANPLLGVLVAQAVEDIEQRLLDGTRASELHLFAAFQTTTSRRRNPIVALGENVVLSNRSALDLLNPSDFAMLRALTGPGWSRGEFQTEVPLQNGARALVRATPVHGSSGGAIFDITCAGETGPADTERPDATPGSSRVEAESGIPAAVESARVGTGGLETPAPARAPAHLPILISGAPGTGRTTAALAAAKRQPVMTLEPALAILEGEHVWAQQFADAMSTQTGTVIVEGIDLLGESLVHLVISKVRESERSDLVVTSGPFDRLTGLAHTLATMCVRTLDLAPLSQRASAIGELAGRMLRELGGSADLRLTPGAIDALTAQSWVGNFHELRAVMAHALARRSAGDVTANDLPAAYQRPERGKTLGGMERAERQAILIALAENKGNKLKAAKSLGVSRTTLYSRIRTLRITAEAGAAGADGSAG